MKITLKLFATLSDYLPPGTRGNVAEIDVPEATTIGTVIEQLHLPKKLVHLVLVDGNYIAPEARLAHRLKVGDQLAIWPPIAGG